MGEQDGQNEDRGQYALNMTLAAVAGQVGCLTIGVIIITLFGGLWLDARFSPDSHIFTILLLLGSIPVTIILMFWVVRKATSRIKPAVTSEKEAIQEDEERGE
jgi:uncharacterized membrane protein